VNEVVRLKRQRKPALEPPPEAPAEEEQHTGRRRGGSRWLGFGALLALIGALAYGGWRYETQQLETAATSKQRAGFVPSLRVATVKASDSTTLVTLPATTLAFAQANMFARASGYIDKRSVDIGDHVKEGAASSPDHRTRARSSDRAGGGHPRPNPSDVASEPGKCRSRQCDLATRQATGR